MNSGPRQLTYCADLKHTGDDDRVGHCHSRWHFRCHGVLVFVVGQKIVLTMSCLYRSKVSSSVCGRATGFVVLSVLKMKGRLRVYVTGHLQRSTDLLVVRQALSPVLPKKIEKLVEGEAKWRSLCR